MSFTSQVGSKWCGALGQPKKTAHYPMMRPFRLPGRDGKIPPYTMSLTGQMLSLFAGVSTEPRTQRMPQKSSSYIPSEVGGRNRIPFRENLYKSFPKESPDSVSRARLMVYNCFMRCWCAVGVAGDFYILYGRKDDEYNKILVPLFF